MEVRLTAWHPRAIIYHKISLTTELLYASTRGQGMDHTQRILELVKQVGELRPRELDAHGIPRIYLSRICGRGHLQRVERGLSAQFNVSNLGGNHEASVC